ncbi:protein PRRC1-like protein [Leptotrombidium deliense]|uniref:Protein PRRC1-like protein n=1 Tax=Leptotrombidium deliense TaxID=299467 RepID=A0A443SPE9_9ACAR|nr:protein PRRC1-like protein [Leptotrombidium deliense]
MSSTSSDNNGDSTFEVISDKDLNNGSEKSQPTLTSQKEETEEVNVPLQTPVPMEAIKTEKVVSPPIDVPLQVNVCAQQMEEVNLSSPAPSSPLKIELGLLNWISNNQFLNQVARKAKNSVDTMITTLDPGMKEFLRGDVSIVVSTTDDVVVSAVRDAFIDVFGRATVKGVESHSSSVAAQPFGTESAVTAAKEKIFNIRTEQSSVVPQNQVIVSVENLICEFSPERFHNIHLLLLEDPMTSLMLDTYTQSVWIPGECVNRLKFETPSDYSFRSSGFSLKISEIMAQKLNVPAEKWVESWTGLTQKKIIYNAAYVLANLYKSRCLDKNF